MRAKLTIAGLLLATVAVGLYWYSQRGMKLSETDSILIGEFSNAAGDSVFDGTLREALGVSLAQSPSLNLVSVEKVREALRSMGRPADSLLLQELAPSLAPRTGHHCVPGRTCRVHRRTPAGARERRPRSCARTQEGCRARPQICSGPLQSRRRLLQP